MPPVWDGLRLLRVANRLGEQDSLFGPQFELLGRVLPIAIVEPGRQTLRGGEQKDVLCDETRSHIIIRLLNLGIRNAVVRLPLPVTYRVRSTT